MRRTVRFGTAEEASTPSEEVFATLCSAECIEKPFGDIRNVQTDDAVGRGMHVGMTVLPVDADLRAADLACKGDRIGRLFRYHEPCVRAEELLRAPQDFLRRDVCDRYVPHA